VRCPLSDAPDLRVDVKSDRSEYRPGEEAEVRFAIKSHDGRPAPGALGIVVLDKALEERAATERGLDQPAGLLGAFRNEERVAGVAFRELLAFDTRQPVPADLDLVAEVALVWPDGAGAGALAGAAFRRYTPNRLVVGAPAGSPAGTGLPLLADRGAVDGKPTAYVCRRYVCLLPVTDPAALGALLDAGV